MASDIIASITLSGGGIRDPQIADGAGIKAEKVIQQYTIPLMLTADTATTVTAVTKGLTIIKSAQGATLMGFEANVWTIATDVSRTVTVDLQKSTAGGAFATVLSSTIGFTNTSSNRVKQSAVISNTSCVQGDIYQVVVTVAGGSGSQAIGLLCALTLQDRLA